MCSWTADTLKPQLFVHITLSFGDAHMDPAAGTQRRDFYKQLQSPTLDTPDIIEQVTYCVSHRISHLTAARHTVGGSQQAFCGGQVTCRMRK